MTHEGKIQAMVYKVNPLTYKLHTRFKMNYVNIAPHCPFIKKATSGSVECPLEK